MPQFKYAAKSGPGDPQTGVLEAESQRAAIARLRDMGYIPVSVEEYSGEEERDTLRYTLTRIRLQDRNLFLRQLANLFESGMTLTRALGTLIEQTQNPKMVKVITAMREDVQRGATFAEALERHEGVFPPMYCSLVRAGEQGGMLDEVLWRMVAFGEQEEELRGKAFAAMVYPAFLFVMGTIAVFVLITFVFPKFTAVFEEFDAKLPWPTVVVMGLCSFMARWWPLVVFAVGAGIFAFIRYARSEKGRLQLDTSVLRVPVLGDVVQKYQMAQFARVLGTLLDNGVPVLTSLRITAGTLSNKAIAGELAGVHDHVAEGDPISASLQRAGHFSPVVVNMFAVGEESGRLGAVAKRMADAYDNEVDRAMKTLTSLFEPIMIVVMGGIIGFLVVAMLLPMLTLSSNIR